MGESFLERLFELLILKARFGGDNAGLTVPRPSAAGAGATAAQGAGGLMFEFILELLADLFIDRLTEKRSVWFWLLLLLALALLVVAVGR